MYFSRQYHSNQSARASCPPATKTLSSNVSFSSVSPSFFFLFLTFSFFPSLLLFGHWTFTITLPMSSVITEVTGILGFLFFSVLLSFPGFFGVTATINDFQLNSYFKGHFLGSASNMTQSVPVLLTILFSVLLRATQIIAVWKSCRWTQCPKETELMKEISCHFIPSVVLWHMILLAPVACRELGIQMGPEG